MNAVFQTKSDYMPMTERDAKRLGALLRSRRESMHPRMTQALLAEQTGLQQKLISRLELGQQGVIDPDVANALVEVLPLTMLELLDAAGFRIPPGIRSIAWLDRDQRSMLETADADDRRVLQRVLDGMLAERQVRLEQTQWARQSASAPQPDNPQ